MKYFTHYWKNDTWKANRYSNPEKTQLAHISGGNFQKRGVEVGDAVYVVTVRKGKLFLCGKMIVGKYCDVFEAAYDAGVTADELFEADEHIIASRSTNHHWDLEVPLTITRKLKFVSGSGKDSLKFALKDMLDVQTLRSVRELDPISAAKLDTLIDKLRPFKSKAGKLVKISTWAPKTENGSADEELESRDVAVTKEKEGAKSKRYTTYFERKSKNREAAIKFHGVTCKACGINFEDKYGEHGKDFIHVHHLKPISEFETARTVNPKTELTVLCPNCHSMVHRKKNETLSLKELKNLLRKNR